MRLKTKDLILCGLFCSLMAVSAFIRVPLPTLPITLQLLTCLTTSMLGGRKIALISMSAYLAMGLLGLPVFSAGGGASYILKPNFGFILGFIPAGVIAGAISGGYEKQTSFKKLLLAAFVSTAVLHVVGCNYFYFVTNYIGMPFEYFECVFACTVCFLPSDCIWCVLSALICNKISNALTKHTQPL